MLGESPEAKFPQFACQLQAGEALILWTDGAQDGLATVDRGSVGGPPGRAIAAAVGFAADELLAAAAKILDGGGTDQQPRDRALVVGETHPHLTAGLIAVD